LNSESFTSGTAKVTYCFTAPGEVADQRFPHIWHFNTSIVLRMFTIIATGCLQLGHTNPVL
jgi:hypothetical protein